MGEGSGDKCSYLEADNAKKWQLLVHLLPLVACSALHSHGLSLPMHFRQLLMIQNPVQCYCQGSTLQLSLFCMN